MKKDGTPTPEAEDLVQNRSPQLTDRMVKDTAYHHPYQPYQVIEDGRILEKPYSPSGYMGEFIDNNGRQKTLKERTKVHRVLLPITIDNNKINGTGLVWEGSVLVHGFVISAVQASAQFMDESGVPLACLSNDMQMVGAMNGPTMAIFPPQYVEKVFATYRIADYAAIGTVKAAMFVEYFD